LWHLAEFQPSEIIALAVKVEEKGAELYKRLAEKAETDEIKDLLLFLASEEEKHQEDFKDLGKDLEPIDPRETYAGEYLNYVRSTVETHMFIDDKWVEKVIETAASETDVVRLAAIFEKDSILFFTGFKKLLNEKKQGIIEDLIKEEEGHLVKLANIMKDI